MNRGISLIEILIAVAIFLFLVANFFPLTTDFFRNQQFNIHLHSIVQSLKRAQTNALCQELDSSFGVYFGDGEYVLFRGASYAERDPEYDDHFFLPEGARISGMSEVVFSRIQGLPSDTGNLDFIFGDYSETIEINSRGVINY